MDKRKISRRMTTAEPLSSNLKKAEILKRQQYQQTVAALGVSDIGSHVGGPDLGTQVALQTATAVPALRNQCVAQEKKKSQHHKGTASSTVVGNKTSAKLRKKNETHVSSCNAIKYFYRNGRQ